MLLVDILQMRIRKGNMLAKEPAMQSHPFTIVGFSAFLFAAGCGQSLHVSNDAGGGDAKATAAGNVGADAATCSTTDPVSADAKLVAKSITSSDGAQTCVVLTDDTVRCWGGVAYSCPGYPAPAGVPVRIGGLVNTRSVSSGFASHNCAVLGDGTIQCWGDLCECSSNGCPCTKSPALTAVSGITKAVAVSAGASHNCALLGNGVVQCWGYNLYGQVGDGATMPTTPIALTDFPLVTVAGIHNATAVVAGAGQTCALLVDGTVQCWGNVLGSTSSLTIDLAPATVAGITNAIAIASAPEAICVLLRGGTIQCLGRTRGGLGDGASWWSSVPVTVAGITNAIAVEPGDWHGCAVLTDGTVACWGDNAHGQLGNGSLISSEVPTKVTGIVNAVAVTVGDRQSCALLSSGSVQCWGFNYQGGLGNGGTEDSSVPVTVVGF